MKIETNENEWLTQASEDVDAKERMFLKEMYLPDGQETMWKTVTDEEKTAWEAEHSDELKDEMPDDGKDADAGLPEDGVVTPGDGDGAEDADAEAAAAAARLEQAKDTMLRKIERYDVSENVNGFFVNGELLWLDKATRVGLVNSTNAVKNSGGETTTLWFGTVEYTVVCDALLALLTQLECYALECYNVTARHKAEVMESSDAAEVEGYDYKGGYPERLVFEI